MFSLVASSAASERTFSTRSFIHNKLRNALSAPKIEKLLYIKANHNYKRENGDSYENDQELSSEE
ncbi:hypothetical protein PHYSODRAFT_506477 [Phytophthora sojae]|uniref:HAT C-terminal dimerisation domain-containing protein n=1 Tax=Phytophthora sojae (strain P6497) TaxID=1094619 RepID=G4ZPZ4_PHYSP|nr:hypothetical protein PHYSODRAFT_506477 [Phytophthora sojae]EGZ16398.1 hypothetical protein PHYSODRAFT_506477 [Phytophthora sojae]|eukprot:XP_009530147.1 hypothetical protein PHYSODRAFT_506477 [Phytophthora sojae]